MSTINGATWSPLQRPPTIKPGNAKSAWQWFSHAERLFGDNAGHIIRWLAFKVQNPAEKINHCLVLGGEQGVGLDCLLEPIRHAVGQWHFRDVSPPEITGRFNGFLKSVILRVNGDLGDVSPHAFYDITRPFIAAPPDTLVVEEKRLPQETIPNVTSVIITTNRKESMYLPPDDRRYFVAWADCKREDFPADYFKGLWGWYSRDGNAGNGYVAGFLRQCDLSDFDPKAPPPRTPAFWEIVNATRPAGDAELRTVLEALAAPAITIAMLAAAGLVGAKDRATCNAIPARLKAVGYAPVRSQAKDGLWLIGGRRQAAYARAELSAEDQLAAVSAISPKFDFGG